MAIARERMEPTSRVPHTIGFESGNEMAARAAAQINYHLMGYFPITPSTEIAQILDQMKTKGMHDVQLIPADGEHGSAGICYGAAAAGARVFNATSANGFMYMLEQLPVQSGTRFPMVLNLVTRSISGPLDIRGDHSDLYFALNTGWVILTASTPQAVYDLNLIALKVAERHNVRLPVIVAFDGFFTSHQKKKVQFFTQNEDVQRYVGKRSSEFPNLLDYPVPVSIGAHMNGDDLMNNHYQLSEAMYQAGPAFREAAAEFAMLSGRDYPALEAYRMEDAEVALFLINSAAESAKDAVDRMRDRGIRAGLIRPNIIRPFPAEELRTLLQDVVVLLVGDRADSYGAHGGNMALEVKAALKDDPWNRTTVISRVYGLGGKDFYPDDAEEMLTQAHRAMMRRSTVKKFDYLGHYPGSGKSPSTVPPMPVEQGASETANPYKIGGFQVEHDEALRRLKVKVPPIRNLTVKPKRLAPGHGACPGCGSMTALELFFKGIEGDVVVLFQTGCAYVVTAAYPFTSHKQSFVHNLFQNGAATLSGVVEAFAELKRRGDIQALEDPTFVMVTGDGGMDIGMGPAIGAALRNHKMIILEYDNEGYMNTGSQLSYSTPIGHMTSTSGVGVRQQGKGFHHKDTPQMMAAANIPYVFTGSEAFPQDLLAKAAKAQWYAQHEGMAYGKMLSPCPLNWKSDDCKGAEIAKSAVDSCFFPLYEVECGVTRITYDPEAKNKRVQVEDWLRAMGKTKHMLQDPQLISRFREEVERRWLKLKAMHEHPLL